MTKDEMTALKIPEEFHENASLKEVKDVAGLAKAFVDTKSMVGSSIRIPGKDAGDEARKEFRERLKKDVPELIELPADPTKFEEVEGMIFERLGRPKDMKEYPALAEAKIEVPAEVKVDEAELRGIAHKLGMTKKQYLAFAKGVVEERTKASSVASEARAALKRELGDATDERLLAAASAAQKFGASEAMVTALRTGNVPAEQVKLWIGVAKATGVQGSEFGREGGGGGKMTPGEALDALAELRRNPALTDRNHPEQKRLTERLLKLTEIAYPDKK
jgi:hypothetical protein